MVAGRYGHIVWALAVLLPAVAAMAQQDFNPEKASFEFLTDRTSYAPGETVKVAARVDIESGWHLQSNTPSFDYLIPTVFKVQLPEGWGPARFTYPEGEMQSFAFAKDTLLSVYDGQVTIIGTLRVPPGARERPVPVGVSLRYQACSDRVCLPPVTKKLRSVLPVGAGGRPANPDVFARP